MSTGFWSWNKTLPVASVAQEKKNQVSVINLFYRLMLQVGTGCAHVRSMRVWLGERCAAVDLCAVSCEPREGKPGTISKGRASVKNTGCLMYAACH